jgi:hypothetical protein
MTRWGASFYFLAQGFAIVLEGAFSHLTGRRVGGPLGTVWSVGWMAGLGIFTYRSW